MKQGINKDLCSIFQLENCFGASFASKATQIPRRVCASPVFARACVSVCVSTAGGTADFTLLSSLCTSTVIQHMTSTLSKV